MAESVVTIDRLGAQGDGIAQTSAGQLYVPFVLPGETANVARHKDRGDLISLLSRSPRRVEPACRHFGECGGCALQHLETDAYLDWKRSRVVDALAGRGIEAEVAPVRGCAPASRRRVTFAARRVEEGMLLGFNRALSHHIVAIGECPVADRAISSVLDVVRATAEAVCATGKPFRVTVTATASGLDLAFHDSGRLEDARRRSASAFAVSNGLARLTVDGEVIVEPRKPVVMFGAVSVQPPPGGFLQAVADAEDGMVGLVSSHMPKAKRVADLFSGVGAFALRLAAFAEVHAVEGDAAALAALDRGYRFAAGLRRVTTERRDLFRRPLLWKELDAFDAVVFDPPRAGAEDQAKQIARSGVPKVAAVSCNPVTLARDLRILIDGGYTLASVHPVDQFLWSPHVEAVALLEKPRRRR